MAARENQGLQIALIVFVTLTVLLSLTTFVFFRNYQNEQQARKGADDTANKERQDRAKMQEMRDKFVQYSGLPAPASDSTRPAEEIIKDATDTWTKEMGSYEPLLPAKLPDDQRSYKKLTEGLAGVVRNQHARLQKNDADLAAAQADLARKTQEYKDGLDKLTLAKDQALKEYTDAREEMNRQVEKLTESKNELGASLTKKDTEYADQKKQLDARIADLDDKWKKTQTQLQLKAERVNEMSGRFSVNAQPDGRIVWVNQRENVVYIDLGSADRLRKRITFAVFDPTTTDVSSVNSKGDSTTALEPGSPPTSQAQRKGVIEVINITQPHLAECRILESTSIPLQPKDLIYTPLWDAGQQEHFALVGLLDIDGDGASDRKTVHDLIRTRGGIIDAETDEKGNLTGDVTFVTRFLVKGDMAQREGFNTQGPYKLIEDAKALGVESVDLAKFLDMMGYVATSGVANNVTTGRIPQPNLPGQPSNNFRTRIPPQRGNEGGAY